MSGERFTVQVDAIGNFSNVIGEVGKFRSQLQNLKLPDKLTAKLEKGFDNVESKVSHFQSLLNKGITTKGDFSKLMSSARAADKALVDLKEDVRAIGDKDLHIAVANSAEIQKAEQALNRLINAGDKLKNFGTSKGTGIISESEVAKIQKLANTSEGLKKKFQDVDNAFKTGNIEQASAAIEKLISHVQRYQSQMNNSKSTPGKGDIVLKWATDVRQALNGMVSEVERTRASLNQLQVDKFNQMKTSINGITSGLSNATNGVRQFINAESEAAARTNQLNEQVGHLRTQANYFFGLQNMGRLIARGVREAAESVRDLDKAMTETAVVTDFSVSDMWKMLPEYTALANKLGATTQGAYETMTLYFQQGLNKQQTFEIGEETMKMARIAGLDYAQTTNMMTAALRGFNMELNQTSAKRVNDVYSELAAITASDTRELGLAMERTASIAHSAGMDFGNTTAFLAQMIETTREAPENLGTAMKTIVARFQELKQNPYEISEVEGEEVDFNRVDKALKSIGVDLMDNKDKFRDLDDVFMDISSRWDGLSQTQQRYIATIAAGARQQSRFLAMVQNYDRLKQLTDAAANSEGASEVQFAKTLESYEAKVNKLKNAWQQYTMSLANNQAIKKTVDWLKDLITFGNKIIKTFGKVGSVFGDFGQGLAEMAASFGLGALGFKGLRGGANLGLKLLGGMTVKGATAGSGMFPGGNRGSAGFASKISNPIVAAINRLTAVVSGQASKIPSFQNAQQRNDLIKERRQNLYGVTKETNSKLTQPGSLENIIFGSQRYKKTEKAFNASDIRRQFSGLDIGEQRQIYKSVPAIRKALQSGYAEAYKKLNLDKAGQEALTKHFKQVDNAVKSGKISATDAFRHLYNPASVAQAIDNPEVTKALNNAVENQMKSWSIQKHSKISARLKQMADSRGLEENERQQFYKNQKRLIAGQELGISNENTAQLSKIAGAMTTISSKASMAGQSIMGLGMALDSIGMHGAGAALTTVGNGLIGIGMAAEGASASVGKLKNVFSVLGKNPMVAAATAIAAIGVAVGGGFAIAHKKMVKDAQQAGKKIVDTYKDTIDKTEKELKHLSEYEENWKVWSAGVDENGNNISLGTGEYEDYLKAVKEITQAHPELIKGYNALGNAIVDNNTVLEKARKLTQDEADKAKKEYLTPESYEKIKTRQKSTKRWQNANEGSGLDKVLWGQAATSNYKVQAQEALDALRQIKGADKILKDFGVTWDETGNITEQGIELIRTKGSDLVSAIKADVGDSDKELNKLVTGASDKVATFGKTVKGLEDVSKDTYDWGIEYASSKGYDKIDSGLITPFQTAIERLAEKGLDESEFTNQIDIIGQKYQDLGGHLEDFQRIQKEVDEAQKELGETANFEGYTDTVEVATAEMDGWIAELRSSTDEADHILAEWLVNQKTAMMEYSKNATTDLSEGLNQDQTLFKSSAEASKRYESVKETIIDYASGINSAKQILDDAMTDQNLEGNGSLTFEQASISILGEDFVKNNANDMDKVKAQMKEFQGWLQDSEGNAKSMEETYTHFGDHIAKKLGESTGEIEGLGGPLSDFFTQTEEGIEINSKRLSELTDEQMAILAEKGLDMSVDWMSGMLNIGRQLGYYSSANIDMIRRGLVEQNGEGSVVSKDGGTVYKRKSDFEEESRLANNSMAETEEIEAKAGEAGIELIGDVSDMTGKSIKTMMNSLEVSGKKSGESFGNDFVKKFEELNYNKDEVSQAIDEAISSGEFTEEETASLQEAQGNLNQIWDNILQDKELAFGEEDKAPEEATAQAAQSIDSKLGQMLAEKGELSKEAYGYDENDQKAGLGYEGLHKVLGGEGQDTMAQFFASGTDSAGNKLTNEQFNTQLSQLQNLQKYYREQEALMRTNAENTSGADQKWWTDQANYAQQAVNYLDNYIQKGQEAHQEKLQQDEEEKTSEDAKTQNKTENDEQQKNSNKNKIDSEKGDQQQLSDTYKNYLDSLNAVNVGQEGQQLLTPNELAAKFGLSDTDIADYQTRFQQLQQQFNSSSLYSGMGLSQEQGDLLGLKRAFVDGQTDLTNFKNTFSQVTSALGPDLQLTKDQLGQIKQNISGLDAGQLNNLNTQQLLSDLKLDNKQIAALEAANINIPVETDNKDLDDTKKKKDDLEKPIEVPVKTKNVSNMETETKKTKDNASKDSTNTTVTNNITLNSIITNPEEPKQKIDITMPKNYKTTVKASISMDASVSAKGLAGKMQKKADSASKGLKVKTGTSTNITAKVSGTKEVKSLNTAIKGVSGKTVKVKADVSGKSQVDTLKSSISKLKDKTVTVTYKQNGKPSGSVGINNHISYQTPIHAKSLAKGTLGNKRNKITDFKGGLTLTGEKGFEIAWLPSENRSMILGTQGPQMINLPRDAVVWTNEQSKKIMKQKAIPAASMRDGIITTGSSKKNVSVTSKNNSGSKNSSSKSSSSKGNSKSSSNSSKTTIIIEYSGDVSVWWENQTRKVDATQRKVDSLLKKFEDELKRVGTTRKSIQSITNSYKKQLNRSIALNKISKKVAEKGLYNLNYSTSSSKRTISYDVTEKTTKKDKKGKKTTTYNKKSKETKVSLSKYIKYDKTNDTYVIDQDAIDRVSKGYYYKDSKGNRKWAQGNASKGKAIKEAAEKEINDKLSKRNTAIDNITKAQEALKKINNDIYESFYRWEKSITRVYILSQKLEELTKRLSIAGSQAELQFAKLEAGINKSNGLTKIKEALANERELLLSQAKAQNTNVNAAKVAFQNSLNFSTYAKKYLNNPNSTEAKGDYLAAKKAFDLLDKLNFENGEFNYASAISALNKKQYNEETNNRIKDVLDKIFEKQNDYLDAINDAYQAQTEIYQKMEEMQSFIAEFEQDLLSGIEEQAEDQVRRLDKLNSALSKAFKDLIDEVKSKLDDRRKKEDNAKTESDIAKKQQRLAALRADTSGGHAVEIAQLEKEIAEAQQNYQRTLEDQLLERLQEQGDKAEKQRQRQIDLLELQNEIAKQTGSNLAEVKEWLKNPEANKEQIRQAWLANKDYDEAAPGERTRLEQEFESEWAKYLAYNAQLPKYQDTVTSKMDKLESTLNSIAKNLLKVTGSRSARELRQAGLSAKQLRKLGYSAKSLKSGGYTAKELKNAGYSAKSIRKAGYSIQDFRKAGFSAKQAVKAGYSKEKTIKAYNYTAAKGMIDLNASGKAVQKAKGVSAKQIQKIINKNPKDNATQKDLAGVQVGKVDVNGKKKGGEIKDSHISATGKRVGANSGSYLYTANWDTNKGKITGGWTTWKLSEFTADLIKKYPIDASQALVYAIQNREIGSFLNKNFKSLVSAAKISGKEYKLNDRSITGIIGANGYIYYNTSSGDVKRWDPAKGKLETITYDKTKFLKYAKQNNTYSKVYAQALIKKGAYTKSQLQKNGVKKFATGGLANSTGLAWLDGTPSKPELVLDAQDTKNFLTLRDVLDKAIGSTNAVENTYGGDTSYEININVDHINNDYDVDRIAERVEKKIIKNANYRNVVRVRNLR